MLKTIITTSLLITAVAQAGSGDYCRSRSVPAPVVVDVAWKRMASFQRKYEDFYYRCGSMIGELNFAEAQARRLLMSAGKGAAADKLITTLIQKAQTLPPEDVDVAYPLTMDAIRQGAAISKALVASTQSMPPRMAAQVKYNTAVNLYRVVKKAYTELDSPYYLEVNRQCYGNCVGISMRDQFNNYADGVVDLAKEYINLQANSGASQGTDRTELGLTAASAKAAKKIVLNSVFRRDYSCAIMELHAIQVEAETFLCEGNPGYNQYSFVEELRSRLANVNFPTRGCGGFGGYHGGRHNGYSSSSQVDVDVNVNVSVDVD